MSAIVYISGGAELFGEIEPLWIKLNEHHRLRSPHFAPEFAKQVFANRLADWQATEKCAQHADIAKDASTGRAVGYCVSTLGKGGDGEIESLYIEPDYRKHGIGEELMRHAMDWLDGCNASSKSIAVAVGNEEALGFYSRFGFYPRRIVLEQNNRE